MSEEARRAVERAARDSYGRLIAFIAARTRDIPAAEDALSEALAAALRVWPVSGTPANPEAWLLTAARRNAGHRARHAAVAARAEAALELMEAELRAVEETMFPDERLKLLFICAHPAIDEGVRTPLMLQTVLGLDAARIAAAYLTAPAAMGQRLVRAKAKIRAAGVPFAAPDASDLPARLDAVLAAIYAAYGLGWEAYDSEDAALRGMGAEAIFLARLVVSLLPEEPEALGLLALMLHCEARAPARRDADGAFIPLSRQNCALWNSAMMEEAESLLVRAAAMQRIGRFQLEAAIQSAHGARARFGGVNWRAIAVLYEALCALAPTIGAAIGRAAALAEAGEADAALAVLDAIEPQTVARHQPYWATRAFVLRRLDDRVGAGVAYERAIALSENLALRAYLQTQLREIAH